MFRYRAWNINGPGETSDVAYLVSARVPSRPPKPIYISSTASEITISIMPSEDDGGKIVTRLILEKADYFSNNWSEVGSYNGISLTHTL
jgi:hypothetical protein